ncbi:hypothetical protein BY996DRAFT_6566290 [Phakopsora pachyrhizi]|nr:hypothetical protein BY996DRAFT_6566290 [Phakopsora pachyrhizi]
MGPMGINSSMEWLPLLLQVAWVQEDPSAPMQLELVKLPLIQHKFDFNSNYVFLNDIAQHSNKHNGKYGGKFQRRKWFDKLNKKPHCQEFGGPDKLTGRGRLNDNGCEDHWLTNNSNPLGGNRNNDAQDLHLETRPASHSIGDGGSEENEMNQDQMRMNCHPICKYGSLRVSRARFKDLMEHALTKNLFSTEKESMIRDWIEIWSA